MLLIINKLKTTVSPTKMLVLAFFASCIFIATQLIKADHFSAQENVLYKTLIEELVNQKICTNSLNCATEINLYRSSGNRIYFNLYSQTDMAIAASVGKFLVKNGIKLSKGMPITLKVYATPKIGPLNSEYYFGHEDLLLKLDLEK
jgi:hypothetical protein